MFTLLIPSVHLWIVVYRLVDINKKGKKRKKMLPGQVFPVSFLLWGTEARLETLGEAVLVDCRVLGSNLS